MSDRHAFLQHARGGTLFEVDQRGDARGPTVGRVLEAAYLARGRAGLLARLARWVTGGGALALRPPFTADGGDALRLFDAPAEAEIVRLTGRVAALSPRCAGDEVVLSDFWAAGARAPWRLVEAHDFAIVTDEPIAPFDVQAVVVGLEMAPLVVARPERRAASSHLEGLEPRTRALASSHVAVTDDAGSAVAVHEGDRVELLALPGARIGDVDDFVIARTRRSLPAWPGSGGYRASGARRGLTVGDRPGMRLVLRVLRPAQRKPLDLRPPSGE